MKHLLPWLLVVPVVGFTGLSASVVSAAEETEEAIRAAADKVVAAFNAGDAEAVAAAFLEQAVAFLEGEARCFDVVLAADVFVYFRDLRRVLGAIAARLSPRGHLVFTCEAAGGAGGIRGNGRFQHTEGEIRDALAAAGLAPRILRPEALRLEAGAPVPGLLVAAGREG